MVILECQMCINPDAQPVGGLCIGSYGPISDSSHWFQFWPEVLPVAPSAREHPRVPLHSVELMPSSASPLNAWCCA